MRKNILFDHNQKAYQATVSMMEETGKAAVIHPTGTGKSFIGFQLCADHKKERICWLSPSEYIYRIQREKWLLAGGEEIANLCFMTYAKLMRLGEEELENLNPNYLILDEFHRLGAAQWGRGVEVLREKYPRMKILGLSATNIRYLDNQRDMAWELFSGNVASELTLGAAIAQGILPAPKYVLSVYSYQKELYRYQARVGQVKNKAVRDRAEKELEALRRALEKAEGLTEVFAKHIGMGTRVEKRKTMGHIEFKSKTEKTTRQKQGEIEKNIKNIDSFKEDKEIENIAGEDNLKELAFKAGKDELNESIFKKEEKAVSGKYIVFCANYEHLLAMKELAPKWFAKVDTNPHIYTAYSDNPMTATEFEAFKKDESDHLKLLYCIDMLNEGIHVDGLSGVILLRPTVSPTIYKQQIGRALAAGGEEIPVIFDIVMNIENLCSIGAVEEELREAVFFCRANGRAEEIVRENFQIVDELGDCRKLFAQLNETLGASWEAMYTMAKEYYKEHGNLEIPAKYTTADGYSLGAWIATQRKVYLGKVAGNLSEEQIRKLTAIGMCWQGTQEAAWERNFSEAEKYFREHGNLCVPADYETEDGCKLGRWVRRQRELYQKMLHTEDEYNKENLVFSRLSDQGQLQNIAKKRTNFHMEHIQRLIEIGMSWEVEDPWEHRFRLAKQYYEEHGNLRMPADYVVDGIWLDRWLREQKVRLEECREYGKEERTLNENPIAYNDAKVKKIKNLSSNEENKNIKKKNELPEIEVSRKRHKPLNANQREKILAIGIRPGVSQAELSWREQYGEAEEFYRRHGNLSIPKRYPTNNGKNLGIWLQHQRANRKNGRLAGWQVHLLDGIGMVWELPDSWEVGFAHAKEYAWQTGNLEVPNAYICADGYRLGKWISNQRCAYGGCVGKGLEQEQIRRLEAIGMLWNAKKGKKIKEFAAKELERK